MRLIDADKLSNEMEFVYENASGMTALAARLVWAFVEKADTVEKKGHWVTTKSIDNEYFQMCDVCQRMASVRTNFCPNCGADMRES